MTESDALIIPSPEQPADAFAAVLALRRLAATLERTAVDVALAEGWTWSDIGSALEMTAQAAHKRLAPARRAPLPDPPPLPASTSTSTPTPTPTRLDD